MSNFNLTKYFRESYIQEIQENSGIKVTSFIDKNNLYVSFVSYSKFNNDFTKETQQNYIESTLKNQFPLLLNIMEYQPDSDAAGIVYKINKFKLIEELNNIIN